MFDFNHILSSIRNGSTKDLSSLVKQNGQFPSGSSPIYGDRNWVETIMTEGALLSVIWIIEFHNQDLSKYVVVEGTAQLPIVHAVLQRDKEDKDKYTILKMVLNANADPNARGFNDYTPAHQAAIDNDVEALEIISMAGADLNLKTRIDEYATPLEEAKIMVGSNEATLFLERLNPKGVL